MHADATYVQREPEGRDVRGTHQLLMDLTRQRCSSGPAQRAD
jgi:hypothetical protein